MSISERVAGLKLQVIDRGAIRQKNRADDRQELDLLRSRQNFLLEQLRGVGLLSPIEDFIGEKIPTIEEYNVTTRAWREKYVGTTRGGGTIEDLPLDRWSVDLPWPEKREHGIWDDTLDLQLTRYLSPRDIYPFDRVGLAYNGTLLVVRGEWSTLQALVPPSVFRSPGIKDMVERALAEAIHTPMRYDRL